MLGANIGRQSAAGQAVVFAWLWAAPIACGNDPAPAQDAATAADVQADPGAVAADSATQDGPAAETALVDAAPDAVQTDAAQTDAAQADAGA